MRPTPIEPGIVSRVARTLLCTVACVLAACATPNASKTSGLPLEVPAAWSHEDYALTGEATSLSSWWLRFGDPLLATLVFQAMDANTDIGLARAAVQQASAVRDLAAAGLSPTFNAAASGQRNVRGDGEAANTVQMGVSAAWDADWFGAKRSAVDATEASLQAAQARLGAAQGAVSSALALNYIGLRSTQARLGIARDNLASQLETLQITRWRNQAGLIGVIEVEQAFVAAELTRTQMAPLELTVERALHALAVQVGKPPADLRDLLAGSRAVPRAPPTLGLGAPKDALRNRPDVQAAKYLVRKSAADLLQAQAQRYPVLSLGGNLGVGAASVQALSNASALAGSALLSLAGPLFDGGASNARISAQQAAVFSAQVAYRAAVLTALREVEDAMSALRADQARGRQLEQVALAAGRAARLARQRYTSGLIDFQIVLETQRSQLATQDNLAQSGAEISSDQVRLFSALGGGWQPDALATTQQTPLTP